MGTKSGFGFDGMCNKEGHYLIICERKGVRSHHRLFVVEKYVLKHIFCCLSEGKGLRVGNFYWRGILLIE